MDEILTDLTPQTLSWAIQSNLFAFFRLLSRSKICETSEDRVIYRWHTAVRHPWFNGVIASQPPGRDADRLIADTVTYFQQRGVGAFSWWLEPGMTGSADAYDIAFVEGSVSRDDEIERLRDIRQRAKVLVAFGSCACFGGVNQLKNRFGDLAWVNRIVYGDHPQATREVSPLRAFVQVDLEIFGCPVSKEEVERIVLDLVLGKTVRHPEYPVCMECKANENICLFDLGEPCLGPVTRAGCNSWCPNSRMGCWGCRGPAEGANVGQLEEIMRRYGFSEETILDRLERCFGGFSGQAEALRRKIRREP